MNGYFKYSIDGVEREFFIGNYALEMTLKKMNANLSDIIDLLNSQAMETIRSFIFYSAEYFALTNSKPVDFDEFSVFQWIDSTGGVRGEMYAKFSLALIEALGLKQNDEEPEQEVKKKKK